MGHLVSEGVLNLGPINPVSEVLWDELFLNSVGAHYQLRGVQALKELGLDLFIGGLRAKKLVLLLLTNLLAGFDALLALTCQLHEPMQGLEVLLAMAAALLLRPATLVEEPLAYEDPALTMRVEQLNELHLLVH